MNGLASERPFILNIGFMLLINFYGKIGGLLENV